ncbi:MAG: HlyC/CorC family transporter [Chlamydiae bacterium]|nr:HlyC/CorC family transporter [Chlamydiota bacterium]
MKFEMWQWYLFLTLSCLVIQGFFAMLEMACVSFNKVRLQYYISQGHKRAIWLNYLLNHPALMFGTTLIMVNAALLIGSECSRKFYESIGVNPSFAPLTQVFLVLVFAEITPMFAGRRYAEHAAKLGIPILYACAMVLKPFIMLLDLVCKLINKIFGESSESGLYLTREELQNIIEEREENYFTSEEKPEFNSAVSNIFTLKNKTAKEVMKPISKVPMIPYGATVEDLRFMLAQRYVPYIPIYKRETDNIVAIAYPRDLLRLEGSSKVRDMARSPWFITEGNSVIQILKQFRKNNKSVAVVLNDSGHATGLLTLDDVIDTIFGRIDEWVSTGDTGSRGFHIVVDKTFPGDMELSEFNKKYSVHLEYKNASTLAEVIVEALGHSPAKGETVRIDQFELTVEDVTLLHIKTVQVRTVF